LITGIGLGAATSDVADAVQSGDATAVRKLVGAKADVNTPQADGSTALHWAVYNDDLATVDLLLKAGANPKVANGFGATPLSMAAETGNAAVVKRLLEAGADANERIANRDTALMMAARSGNVDAIAALLDRGADVNATETVRGTTALMWAAAQGHASAVQLLVDRGADIKATSAPAWQDRPVRYGKATDPRPSQGRNQDLVVSQVGPRNTRARDGGGLTPLVFAVRANNLDSVRALLKAGHPEPLLQPGVVPARQRRRPEPHQQGCLVAAVPRGGQSQHRGWGLSGPEGGHGWPGVHQEAARQGRQRQPPGAGVDVVPHRVHVAVGA
jgi:ankyrin repeat protein